MPLGKILVVFIVCIRGIVNDLVNDHVNWPVWTMRKRVEMIMRKRDRFCILLLILGGIGEYMYLYILITTMVYV